MVREGADGSTKGEIGALCGLYLLMNLSVNKIQHSRNNRRPLTKQIPWILAGCQPAIILKALFIFQAYLRIPPPLKPKLLVNSHFYSNLHSQFTMRSALQKGQGFNNTISGRRNIAQAGGEERNIDPFTHATLPVGKQCTGNSDLG